MPNAASQEIARVLMTGATGFVGQHLCQALTEQNVSVRAVVRSSKQARMLLPSQCEPACIDHINGDTDWSGALRDVDAVVHLAARVHVMRDRASDPFAQYREVNTEGTRRLAEAAVDAGVDKFIYLSTVKVNGESTFEGHAFTIDDAPYPQDPYARSKWEAEQLLHRIAGSSGLETTVLRPPLIYGPGVGANFLALMRWVDRGVPLPLGAVRNRRSLLYVGNLAAAVIACLESSRANGQTFLLGDGEAVSTPALVNSIAAHMGKSPRLWPVPVPLLRVAGRLSGKSSVIERLVGSLEVDSQPVRRRLGWSPPYSMDRAMAATVAWYRQHKRSA